MSDKQSGSTESRKAWIEVQRHEHYPSGRPYTDLFCPYCGRKDHNGDGQYCGYCGAKIEMNDDGESCDDRQSMTAEEFGKACHAICESYRPKDCRDCPIGAECRLCSILKLPDIVERIRPAVEEWENGSQ